MAARRKHSEFEGSRQLLRRSRRSGKTSPSHALERGELVVEMMLPNSDDARPARASDW